MLPIWRLVACGWVLLDTQHQREADMEKEFWALLSRWMSCTCRDVQYIHFNKSRLSEEASKVVVRWHHLDNGNLAFRLVDFKTSLSG